MPQNEENFYIDFSVYHSCDFTSEGANLLDDLYDALGNYEINAKDYNVTFDTIICNRCDEMLFENVKAEDWDTVLICPNCDVDEA